MTAKEDPLMGGTHVIGHGSRSPRGTGGYPEPGPGSGVLVLVAGLGVVLAVGLVTALVVARRPQAPAPAALAGSAVAAPAPVVVAHTVVYELSGRTGARDVTYVMRDGGIAQVERAGTPWSVSADLPAAAGSTRYYSLTARP